MNILGSIFDEVIELVKVWKPSSDYNNEEAFRDDLILFLRNNLGKGDMLRGSRNYSIQKEAGRGLADIGVERSVGIELKFNLKQKSQADRLFGQVKEFLKDYSEGVVVVLCGDTDVDKEDYARSGLRDFSGGDSFVGNRKQVVVIKKGKTETGKESVNEDRGNFPDFKIKFPDINI